MASSARLRGARWPASPVMAAVSHPGKILPNDGFAGESTPSPPRPAHAGRHQARRRIRGSALKMDDPSPRMRCPGRRRLHVYDLTRARRCSTASRRCASFRSAAKKRSTDARPCSRTLTLPARAARGLQRLHLVQGLRDVPARLQDGKVKRVIVVASMADPQMDMRRLAERLADQGAARAAYSLASETSTRVLPIKDLPATPAEFGAPRAQVRRRAR